MRADPDIKLRRAVPADRDLLAYWDTKPHVLAATHDAWAPDLDDDDFLWQIELRRDPDWRELLIGEADGRPVGFVQIIDPAEEDSHYWGDIGANLRAIDIWIGEEADLGRGYGTVMMRLALERCFAGPAVSAVLIDPLASNVRAHRFYERLGFTRIGRRFFGVDDCFVYRLDREAWQQAKAAATDPDT
jgi:aminoglycoside 6'-N-acetyltransferase